MPRIVLRTDLATSAEEIWRAIGEFDSFADWYPFADAVGDDVDESGNVRRIHVKGFNGVIVERLETKDDRERVYRYSMVEGPLPVADYRAELRVVDNEDGTSTVEWTGSFEPKGASEFDAVRQVQTLFQSGLDNLGRLYGVKK